MNRKMLSLVLVIVGQFVNIAVYGLDTFLTLREHSKEPTIEEPL